MSVLSNTGIRAGASGAGGDAYQIEKSIRFNGADSAYLSKTFSSASSTTHSVSFWLKRCLTDSTTYEHMFNSTEGSSCGVATYGNIIYLYNGTHNHATGLLLRDPSAWYHVMLSVSSGTAALYVNNEEVQSGITGWTFGSTGRIGGWNAGGYFLNGYLAEIYHVDGQALTASDFGKTNATTGQWIPIEYTGSYGTNGFYLKFNGDGQIYSDEIVGSDYNSTYSKEKMFDGNTATSYLAGDSSSVTWTPTGGLAFSSTLKIKAYASPSANIVFNWDGGSYTLAVTTNQYYDVSSSVTSPITSVTWTTHASAGGPYVYAVEVDGKVLQDHNDIEADSSGNGNHWTANNLSTDDGGVISVLSATGGLPFWNTSDDIGATISSGARTDSNSSNLKGAWPLTSADSNVLTDDESGNGRTLSSSGTIASDTSDYRFYGSSAAFSASGYYYATHSDFTFGTGDFTIEAWILHSTLSGSVFSTSTNALSTTTFNSRLYANGTLHVYTSGSYEYTTITGVPTGKWFHLAMVRSGTSMKVFIDGVLKVTNTNWNQNIGTGEGGNFYINKGRDGCIARNMQDVRVYTGVAKYSSDFQPPRGPDTDIAADCDVSTDTPTPFDDELNGTGNYATLNPLENEAGTPCTLSQGNLEISVTSGHVRSTIGMSSGEWYCEYTHGTGLGMIGLADGETETAFYLGQATKGNGYGYYSTGTTYGNDSGGAAYGASYTTGDVIGVAFDADAGTLTFYKNNTSQGTAFTSLTSGPYFFAVGVDTMADAVMNFGQRPFAYTPPTDYLALNTYNLNDTEITSGEYVGNGDADGPVIWMNATPATLNIDTTPSPTSSVTFSPTTVDPLAGGFKIRNASTNNGSGTTYYWSAPTTESAFKYANAQSNE